MISYFWPNESKERNKYLIIFFLNIVAKLLLQLLPTMNYCELWIFSFQPIDASLSLKKNENFLRNEFFTFLNDLQFHHKFILCGHEMLLL